MKKTLVYAILLVFVSTGVRAQDFDLGDVMGEAQDFFGEAQEKAEYEANTEAQKKFEAAFKDKFKKWGEFSNNLDNYTSYSKCFYLMVKYISELEILKEETKSAGDCKRTYDLYGMQLMSMMSSTSIMYCTEELYNKISDAFGTLEVGEQRDPHEFDELNDFVYEMTYLLRVADAYERYLDQDPEGRAIYLQYRKNTVETDFEVTMMSYFESIYADNIITKNDGMRYFDISKVGQLINKYFHPLSLMREGVDISQKMDRLKPCAGL